MAKLFNKQILNRHIQKHSLPNRNQKQKIITKWKRNLTLNKNVKEKELQAAFLRGIFGDILGYMGRTDAEDKKYTMKIEASTEVDATKPDGSLGFFEINGAEKTKAVIELKGPKISLDKKQKRSGKNYGTPVEQAFGYATKYDGCEWVVVSNMIEIRLYKYARGQGHYEEFLIPELVIPENFTKFHLLLSRPNLISQESEGLTAKLTRETIDLEEDITTEFYNLYKQTRIELFEHLKAHNSDYDQQILFEKAQKFLDRIIFICFCEDLGLLPPNILHKAIKSGKDSFSMSDTKIWTEVKGIFKAIDEGNASKSINAYNGGLFKPDEILHQLTIKDEFFSRIDAISAYDFDSELDVNILGHIFEQSISDIEEIKADIQAEEYNQQESKRKKEGIFYTPEYITKYIVENSVGKYIEDIKAELGYEELPDIDAADSPQLAGKYRKKHLKFYDEYVERLRSIKILDPACGSGAFLNQAFDYLLQEYKWVQTQRSMLEEGQMNFFLQDILLKQILQDNLYGVDLNQESVEITKLSLWLKSANKNKPLANLDDNIKCGNSLIDDPKVAGDKAFDWNAEFPGIMANGGFDVVIGNPPYVRAEKIIKPIKKYLNKYYDVYNHSIDLFAYFYEKSLYLLNKKGYLGFISNRFDKTKSGNTLRQFISNKTSIYNYIDFNSVEIFEGVTTYPIILIIKNSYQENNKLNYLKIQNSKFKKDFGYKEHLSKTVCQKSLNDKNWNFNSIEESKIYHKIAANPKLKKVFGKCYYGIKTGLNELFITKLNLSEENSHLIPIYEGKDISKWYSSSPSKKLVLFKNNWTKQKYGNEIDENEAFKKITKDFPLIAEHLEKKKTKAMSRYDKGEFWWELRNCAYYDLFNKPKVIFPNLQNHNKFCFDEKRNFVNAPAVFIPIETTDLLAILNSKLIWFFLKNICVIRNGGYIEVKPQYFEQIPIPKYCKDVQNKLINVSNKMIDLNKSLIDNKNIIFMNLIYKYSSLSGPTLSTITTQSQFFNQIYTGRARKVRPLTVNINDNILTVYAEKTGFGLYELFKFQVDDDYQRRYIQLYLENLTEEQLEEIDNYSGNLPEKIQQIEIPDYNKPNVVRKVVNEWQSLQDEIESLQTKIEQTDREVDEMVYELYDLTDEEIEIVEESV